MAGRKITIEDLTRVLRESAGTDEDRDLDGDILDADFGGLGYDSLILLETAARITREYGIELGDDVATSVTTPRGLLEAINAS